MNTISAPAHVPSVSVVTATWNRAHLLTRCYDSLCRQAPLPFEWIVVDDGSTDETPRILENLSNESPFSMHCMTQPNGGKHRAVNRAVAAAAGDLVLILDSDDMLAPQALAVITREWQLIPVEVRNNYAGLVGHSVDRSDRLIGRPFPMNGEQVSPLRLFHSAHVQGDKLFVHRAEILREYPFPTFGNETFVSEGIVWDRIRKSYRYRLLNDALQIVEYQHDGLSATSLAARVNNPAGARAYYRQLASLDVAFTHRLRSLVNYVRFARHGGVRGRRALSDIPWPVAAALLFPVGEVAAWVDRARLRARRKATDRI